MVISTKSISGRTWHFSHAIGHHVAAVGFASPSAIAVGADDILYVSNCGISEGMGGAFANPLFQPRITKTTVEQEHICDSNTEEVLWPEGLAVDKDGNVYCADSYSNMIFVYDSDLNLMSKWGSAGLELGKFNGPSGLAFDSEDQLLISDSMNHRIQKFTKSGKFISSWGSRGTERGLLLGPWGIATDQNQDVYVADWGNNRVQKFSSDGEFIQAFGSLIADGGKLNHPSDVAIDADGDVYVTDLGNNRVQVYYPDGEIICGLYGDDNQFSSAAQDWISANPDYVKAFQRVDPVDLVQLGRFERPRGVAVDGRNRIAITDCMRGRVQVYVKDKDYVEPQFNL